MTEEVKKYIEKAEKSLKVAKELFEKRWKNENKENN